MDWKSILDGMGIVGSAASGGVFGLIGSGISAVVKYFRTKQEQEIKREEWVHEREMFKLQMDAQSQMGSWEGLTESVRAEQALSTVDSYPWVNAIKSLFRPALTAGLVVVCVLLFRDIVDALAGVQSILTDVFTVSELAELLKYIVYSIVFSATTAVVWWFSERAFQPPGFKNR